MEAVATISESVSIANSTAVENMMNADPILSGIDLAHKCIASFGSRKQILHAGPPIEWEQMCGAQKGAVIGAILYEHWRETPEDAEKLAASGEIAFDACHNHSAVGPMAGVIWRPREGASLRGLRYRSNQKAGMDEDYSCTRTQGCPEFDYF
jgi:hypothetical protein